MSDTGTRLATDGTRLFTRHWPAQRPRAALVLVHGLGEHLGRYEHVGAGFSGAGIDVRGSDTRGFGASGGPRTYADSFATLLDDIVEDMEGARSLGVPVVLLGHSLGGLQALLYAASDRPPPDLLVLSSPALRNTLPWYKNVAVQVLSRLVPRMTIKNPVDVTQLSRDQTVGEEYQADPLVVQKSTFGLGRAAVAAIGEVPDAVRALDLPTLVIHGETDRIVVPAISEPLASLSNVERRVFPGFRHESFNEDGGRLAIDTVVGWIEDQLAASA